MPRRFGWKRPAKSSPHPRLARPEGLFQVALPVQVDLRTFDARIEDQGQTSGCTAWAAGGFAEHVLQRSFRGFTISKLALYYWERLIDGDPEVDQGSTIATAFTVLSQYGCPPIVDWDDSSNLYIAPNAETSADARRHLLKDPQSVAHDPYDLRAALAAGKPICFGFEVPEQFESEEMARTGIMKMPGDGNSIIHNDNGIPAGHANVLVGYSDIDCFYWSRNSYGASWGLKGYCQIPYDFVHSNHCDDFHTGSNIS